MANPFTNIGDMIGFQGPSFSGIFSWVKTVSIALGVLIVVAVFTFVFFRYKNKQAKGTEKEIHWWEETSQGLVPVKCDIAEEISIPGSSLKLFHIKKTNTWLPRFSHGITPKTFFVAITKNREIVNFTLKSLDKDMKEAGLVYDHTDMRWAAENLREFVKRNYRDKSVPWWREYQGVISTAVFIVIMTASLGVILYLMRGLMQDLGSIAGQISDAASRLDMCSPTTSGIIQQGVAR